MGNCFYYLIFYFFGCVVRIVGSQIPRPGGTYLAVRELWSLTAGPPQGVTHLIIIFEIICFSNEISNVSITSMFSFLKKIFQNSYTSFFKNPCIPIWTTKKKIPCNYTISVISGSVSLVAFSLEWLTLFVLSRHRLYLWHYGLSLWIISLTLWVICCRDSGLLFASVEFFCLFIKQW